MNNIYPFRMGPAAAPQAAPATKFWNVASINDDEGEITLYGDVVSAQPTSWWTGEPIPGQYITPEGFMEDLEPIKNKSRITVKLNSCGGDLYTGIAIHNALKSLPGKVNVVVEGIAASAASVIMCAGDTVSVFPGSLVMIHGVSVFLYDAMNIQDMKLLMKGMDASERAVAEIYNAKTGIEVDTLRSMMTKETWFTGREAIDKGFADELKEGEGDPEMSMSADKKVLFVNSVRHNIEGLRNVPGGIPVKNVTPPAGMPGVKNKPSAKAAKKEGGNNPMTLEEMRAAHPELVAQIEQAAVAAAQTQANDEAVTAERERLAAIDSIAASIPDQQMVNDAKYGDNRCTAQELCFRVMQQSAAAGQNFLANYQQGGAASGANNVTADGDTGTGDDTTPLTKEQRMAQGRADAKAAMKKEDK